MYYAFFDVDETLIQLKTMVSFLKFFFIKKRGIFGLISYYIFLINVKLCNFFGISRNFLNKRYYRNYKDCWVKEVFEMADIWFEEMKIENLYISSSIKELLYHKKNGADVVLISGSFLPCLLPIAFNLGIAVENIICTELEHLNGKFTGSILGNPIIGVGKRVAIKTFLKNKGHEALFENFAYGDHISDLPMLEEVANPCIMKGNLRLEKIASDRGWKILDN